MKYYFLQEDLDQLDFKIAELEDKMKEAKKEKHISATQSSETWHDNYGFEESMRQINFLANDLAKLLEIKNNAYSAKPPKNNKAGIGSVINYKDTIGKEFKIKIGSYLIFAHKPNYISYESPLGKILMNAREGEVRKGVINGKEKIFTIFQITQPVNFYSA